MFSFSDKSLVFIQYYLHSVQLKKTKRRQFLFVRGTQKRSFCFVPAVRFLPLVRTSHFCEKKKNHSSRKQCQDDLIKQHWKKNRKREKNILWWEKIERSIGWEAEMTSITAHVCPSLVRAEIKNTLADVSLLWHMTKTGEEGWKRKRNRGSQKNNTWTRSLISTYQNPEGPAAAHFFILRARLEDAVIWLILKFTWRHGANCYCTGWIHLFPRDY